MVTVAEIRDEKTIEAWLTGRSREDAIRIAYRAAMRVAPAVLWGLDRDRAQRGETTELAILWPLLASGVGRKFPTPEVRFAAEAAAADYVEEEHAINAAYAAAYAAGDTDSASPAALAAAFASAACFEVVMVAIFFASVRASVPLPPHDDTFLAAAAASEAAWKLVRNDCAELEGGRDPFDLPLYNGAVPDEIAEAWEGTRADWAKAGGPTWGFWTQFYENALAGRPQDWPLLHAIALIPEEDWKGGPKRVHPIIVAMLRERPAKRLS